MAKVYQDDEANLGHILDKSLAVIGCGIQGRSRRLTSDKAG